MTATFTAFEDLKVVDAPRYVVFCEHGEDRISFVNDITEDNMQTLPLHRDVRLSLNLGPDEPFSVSAWTRPFKPEDFSDLLYEWAADIGGRCIDLESESYLREHGWTRHEIHAK